MRLGPLLAVLAATLLWQAAPSTAHADGDRYMFAPGYGVGAQHFQLSQNNAMTQSKHPALQLHEYGYDFSPSMRTFFLEDSGIILAAFSEASAKTTSRMNAERELAEDHARGGSASSKQYSWERSSVPPPGAGCATGTALAR